MITVKPIDKSQSELWPYNLLYLLFDDVPDEALSKDQEDALMSSINSLQDRCRDALLLRYRDGLSVEEIAKRLNTTMNQVKCLLMMALADLRRPPRRRHITEDTGE